MTRLLYIMPGLVPPGDDPSRDRFAHLSEIAEGEVLLPVWWASPKEAPPYLRETFPVHRAGRFRYHLFLYHRFLPPFRRLAGFLFYIWRGLQLHREKKFDIVMAYGTNRPGIAALILKWITGAKLIVEVPGVPENAFRYDAPNPGPWCRMKRLVANLCLVMVGRSADCIKLLYPSQLCKYPRLKHKPAAIFHDFVPVRTIHSEPSDERFVLSVGYPWYTKGMDIAIRAFKSVANRFPDYKLKIMGYIPDRNYLDELAAGCSQIEFLAARPNDLALKIIGSCSVYLLASRTEGVPRVLLEAMAAQRPILASVVGGVPSCVTDNENGLLFQSENIADLAAKLVEALTSASLRARLSQRGHERVMSEFDERAYVDCFKKMLDSVQGPCSRHAIDVARQQERREATLA